MDDIKRGLDEAAQKILNKITTHQARIGILAATRDKDRKKGDPLNNAELAAVHEFGSLDGRIPSRSFFRLTEKQKGKEFSEWIKSQQKNIFDKINSGKTQEVMAKLGMKWEAYIHECFETEGWGAWKPLSEAYLAEREAKRRDESQGAVAILQDTGAMERSIISEVVKCSQK